MCDVTISTQAYCKILMHCAKYPHSNVNGVLIANVPRIRATKEKEVKNYEIIDAFPLFHMSLALTPMFEIALTQIDALCRKTNSSICGYYQANDLLNDSAPNIIATKISDKIRDHFQEACMLMIDNEKFTRECKESILKPYFFYPKEGGGTWNPLQKDKFKLAQGALAVASGLLHAKTYRDFVDFENHLEDITLDWRNLDINYTVQHSV